MTRGIVGGTTLSGAETTGRNNIRRGKMNEGRPTDTTNPQSAATRSPTAWGEGKQGSNWETGSKEATGSRDYSRGKAGKRSKGKAGFQQGEEYTKAPPVKGKGKKGKGKEKNQGIIRILALNVNGLRQKRKVDALGGFLASLPEQPDICILTETHLSKHETDGILLDTYEKAHASCREMEVEQACVGVLLMVKHHVRYRTADEVPSASLALNSCSILEYRYAHDIPAVRVTGVYLPPSAKPRLGDVAVSTDADSQMLYQGTAVGL